MVSMVSMVSSHRLFEHLEELGHPERGLGLGVLPASQGLVPGVTDAPRPRSSPLVTGHRVIGAYALVITHILLALLRPEAGLKVGPGPGHVGVGGVHVSVARCVHHDYVLRASRNVNGVLH